MEVCFKNMSHLQMRSFAKGIPSMALIKSHLINAIAEQNGFTKIKPTETAETILKIIESTLSFEQDIMISGFGKFVSKINRSAEVGIRQPERI